MSKISIEELKVGMFVLAKFQDSLDRMAYVNWFRELVEHKIKLEVVQENGPFGRVSCKVIPETNNYYNSRFPLDSGELDKVISNYIRRF